MSFTYNAGSTTPTYAGLAEFNGVRINDGSFRSEHLGGLVDTPDLRGDVNPLPSDDGGYAGPPLLSPRTFSVDGWIYTTVVDDVFGGMDYLRSAFAIGDGSLKTLVCKQRQWATRRQCQARVDGRVTFVEPDVLHKKIGRRDFSIPMIAPDPVLYDADNVRTATLPMDNSHITLTNAGSAYVPFTARFTGPWNTAASLIDNTTGIEITLTLNLAAGHYIDVNVDPVVGISAIQDGTTNVYNDWTTSTLRKLAPGSNSWRAAGSSATTAASQVVVTWRDGWL